MSLIETLQAPDVLFALALFVPGAIAEPWVEAWIVRHATGIPPLRWAAERMLGPLLRAALMLGFVLLAYPSLFGLDTAPTVGTLLDDPEARPSTALGAMLLIAIAASLLRPFDRRTTIVLPLQGMLAIGFLFNWLKSYLHITVASVWPGATAAALLLAAAYFTAHAAELVGRALGTSLRAGFGITDGEAPARRAAALIAQLPLLFLYGAMLGRQLAI